MLRIDGLIMAGGRSLRIKELGEKPMIRLNGRPLIDYVLKAMSDSKLIKSIHVAVSSHTKNTTDYLKRVKKYHFQIVQTPGAGYIEDLRYAINLSGMSDVLVCPADTPFLRGELLDLVVEEFFRVGKPSLVTVVPLEMVKSLGLEPTTIMKIDELDMVPTGVNVVKGEKLVTGATLEEGYFKVSRKEFAININSRRDLKIAEKILKKRPKKFQPARFMSHVKSTR